MTSSSRDAALGRNSLALTVSAAATAGLGLVYWIVVGRLYPPTEVGAAAAVITAATMLSAFGNLGLGAYFERFLPVAGPVRTRLAVRGMTIGAVGGLLLGVGFLLVGPTGDMFANTTQRLLFPMFVVALSSFALLDHLSIAMHRADWAATKNIVHAVVKLGLAAGAAAFIGRTGITLTWIGTAVVVGAVLAVVAFVRLRADSTEAPPADLPPMSEQLRFAAGNYGVYVVTALAPLILPMIVIARVGAGHNAYFAIVWSLITAVTVLLTMLMGPYVSAVAAQPERMRELSTRFATIMLAVAGLACVGLVVAGPIVLSLAGSDYAEHGARVLQLAALALPLAAVNIGFTALSRVRRRLAPALAVQIVTATLMLTLTVRWIDGHGLIAAAWAMLIAEGAAAVLVSVPLIHAWRGSGRSRSTVEPEPEPEPELVDDAPAH
ncbi:MAG: oligosaccharide flippase family protein [Gordonia sp. (in: high G+C Gram-positive bacteria)]